MNELITELKILKNIVCGATNQIQELVNQYDNAKEKDEGLYLECVESIAMVLEFDIQRSVERIIADINNSQGTSQTSVQFKQFGNGNNVQLAKAGKIALTNDGKIIVEEW